MPKRTSTLSASSAFTFVLTMGIVNLFSDMTYEGAGGINGPFLGTLGASAAAIGAISGIGEFFGFSLRFIAGYVSDKTGKYWLITFIGYSINLLAVPAMALAGNWPLAAGLLIAERVGRAIRKPTVEAIPIRPAVWGKAGSTASIPRWTRPGRRWGRCLWPSFSRGREISRPPMGFC